MKLRLAAAEEYRYHVHYSLLGVSSLTSLTGLFVVVMIMMMMIMLMLLGVVKRVKKLVVVELTVIVSIVLGDEVGHLVVKMRFHVHGHLGHDGVDGLVNGYMVVAVRIEMLENVAGLGVLLLLAINALKLRRADVMRGVPGVAKVHQIVNLCDLHTPARPVRSQLEQSEVATAIQYAMGHVTAYQLELPRATPSCMSQFSHACDLGRIMRASEAGPRSFLVWQRCRHKSQRMCEARRCGITFSLCKNYEDPDTGAVRTGFDAASVATPPDIGGNGECRRR